MVYLSYGRRGADQTRRKGATPSFLTAPLRGINMRKTILAAALLAICGAASAQSLNADTSSNAGAISNSESYSGSASQSGGNTINPNQSVGVGFTQTYEASVIPTDTTTRVKTNSAVPLAA